MLSTFNKFFPLWAVLVATISFLFADVFSSAQSLIVPLLALVMFVMGLTLSAADFRRIFLMPKPVGIGVVLQFLLMPLIAITLANLLQLSAQLTAGLVLVGSCAGGTASNVICFLAKGDVALSVTMTMVSTVVGVVATPLLCTFYLAESISVDTVGMVFDMLQVVLAPVLSGIIVNYLFGKTVQKLSLFVPSISILAILLIIGIIVALNAERLLQVGLLTLVAVVLHNCLGLTGGYYLSRIFGLDQKQSRTIAIEVGMQNSGLGVALALDFFSATAALPGALFSVWHNVSGSLLASYWGNRVVKHLGPIA